MNKTIIDFKLTPEGVKLYEQIKIALKIKSYRVPELAKLCEVEPWQVNCLIGTQIDFGLSVSPRGWVKYD